MTDSIPQAVRERLTVIETQLSALQAEDAAEENFIKEAQALIEEGQQSVKAARDRILIRGLELTKLENERNTINMVVSACRSAFHKPDAQPVEEAPAPPVPDAPPGVEAPEPQGLVEEALSPTLRLRQRILRALSQAREPLPRRQISAAVPEYSPDRISAELSILKNKMKLVISTPEGWALR